MGNTIFTSIIITPEQLSLSLDMIESATYIFTPSLKTINTPTWTTSIKGRFITLYNSDVFLNRSLGNDTNGIYFIKGTADETIQMTIGDFDRKLLIKVDDAGNISVQSTGIGNLSSQDDMKLLEYETTAGEDKKFSIMLAGKANHFLVYDGRSFVFKDITSIDTEDVYNSIYLKLADRLSDCDVSYVGQWSAAI